MSTWHTYPNRDLIGHDTEYNGTIYTTPSLIDHDDGKNDDD